MDHCLGMQLVKTIRERLQWTNYKLAKELGITPTSLKNLEGKTLRIETPVLYRLWEVSGMPVDEFWKLLEKDVVKYRREFKKKVVSELPG